MEHSNYYVCLSNYQQREKTVYELIQAMLTDRSEATYYSKLTSKKGNHI